MKKIGKRKRKIELRNWLENHPGNCRGKLFCDPTKRKEYQKATLYIFALTSKIKLERNFNVVSKQKPQKRRFIKKIVQVTLKTTLFAILGGFLTTPASAAVFKMPWLLKDKRLLLISHAISTLLLMDEKIATSKRGKLLLTVLGLYQVLHTKNGLVVNVLDLALKTYSVEKSKPQLPPFFTGGNGKDRILPIVPIDDTDDLLFVGLPALLHFLSLQNSTAAQEILENEDALKIFRYMVGEAGRADGEF